MQIRFPYCLVGHIIGKDTKGIIRLYNDSLIIDPSYTKCFAYINGFCTSHSGVRAHKRCHVSEGQGPERTTARGRMNRLPLSCCRSPLI